jgi:hypothetical protein
MPRHSAGSRAARLRLAPAVLLAIAWPAGLPAAEPAFAQSAQPAQPARFVQAAQPAQPAPLVRATQGTQATGRPPAVPPTRLGIQVLARCPVVVVARTISVRDAGLGASLLHVRVVERMLGAQVKPDDDLPVFSASQQFQFGDEDLLFLRPYRSAGRYEVVERVSARDPHYASKLSYARRNAWLTEVRDTEERVDATLTMLLSLLQSPDEWTALQALDELRWMAGEVPDCFTAGRIQRLRAAGRICLRKEIAAGVESVATLLTSRAIRAAPGRDKEQSRP